MIGEVYRVLHKKSLYLFIVGFLILSVGAIVVAQAAGMDAEDLLGGMEAIFTMIPTIIGGYLFSAFYSDDLNSKNLPTVIGYGITRPVIVISKLLLVTIFAGIFCAVLPIFLMGVLVVLGVAQPGVILDIAMKGMYALSLKSLLEIVGFSAVAAIVVFGFQRSTFGVVSYLMLALGVVTQIASTILNLKFVTDIIPGLSNYLLTNITMNVLMAMMGIGQLLTYCIQFGLYIAVATVLAIVAFKAKELEF
jgi:hypothetical protein